MTKNINFSKMRIHILGAGLIAIAVLIIGVPSFAKAEILNRQLEIGMSGSDVSALQTFLAQDPTLYPQGLVTNYFGFLTKSAVSNFQTRNGLPAVGRVGPATLPVLNIQMAGGISNGSDVYGPTISSVNINVSGNTNTAVISWNTSEAARGVVYYSTSPLTTYERINSVDVSGSSIFTDTNLRSSQSITIPGLQRNTTYYYLIYSTDQAGNVSVTWPTTFFMN